VRACLSAVLFCGCAAVIHAQSFNVEWADERLSVAASDASLPAVLAEVGRQTNVRFVGLDRITGNLNADVKRALLLDALETLLADVNYLVSKDSSSGQPDTRLVIWLHPRTGGAPAANSSVTDAQSPAAPADNGALLEKMPAVLDSWLTALKSDDAAVRMQALQRLPVQDEYASTVSQVLEGALEDADANVRDQAFELLSVHAPEEKVLERVESLLAHPSAEVRVSAVSALRGRSGDDVERLLNRALSDQSSAVQTAASELLREAQIDRDGGPK
jgi:hypothetical protein